MNEKSEQFSISLEIENSHTTDMMVNLEPWGEAYRLPPQATFTIVIKSVKPGVPQLELDDIPSISFFAWPEAVISIYYDDIEITPPRDIQTGKSTGPSPGLMDYYKKS